MRFRKSKSREEETYMAEIDYDEDKFRELLLYVAARMQDDPSFGATKLNKVLFYADFYHYAEYGQPITGAVYQKLAHGPAPKRLLPVQRELVADESAAVQRLRVGNFTQKRLVPLRDADLTGFSGTEIAMVEWVIEKLQHHSAITVSGASHRMLGWQIAAEGEVIPYASIFLYEGPVTHADEIHGKEVAGGLARELATAGSASPA